MSAFVDYVTPAGFVAYDETGEIHTAGRMGIGFVCEALSRGERMILADIPSGAGAAVAGHYVDLSKRRPALAVKAPCPAQLDRLTLTCLPVPCRIEVSNPGDAAPTVYPCADASLTLAFDHAAVWTVRILSAPYLPGTFTVTTDA